MASANNRGRSHNLTTVMVAVVIIAIIIITLLTITAIWSGPPTV
jgi:hypothetical protein